MYLRNGKQVTVALLCEKPPWGGECDPVNPGNAWTQEVVVSRKHISS